MAGAKSDDADMKNEVARFWKHLNKLHAEHPKDYDKFISQTLDEGKELFEAPQPVYCLKIAIAPKYNCSRLYLNVCQWDKLPHPKSDSDPVPVKGGVLRHKMDKASNKKTDELIYDIAFNPKVLAEIVTSRELQEMLNRLCFDYLEDIVGITVTKKQSYTKLKEKFTGPEKVIQYCLDENWKYQLPQESRADFGDSILKEIGKLKLAEQQQDSPGESHLPTLKVRPDSAPSNQTKPKLIEEISSNPVPAVCKPNYTLTVRETEVGLGKVVCAVVTLPGVKSVTDITLDVSKDSLSLSVEGLYELSVKLPAPVSEEKTKAAFKPKTGTLSITMPCF